MTAVELEKNLREVCDGVTDLWCDTRHTAGEDPGAEDEVGRGTPEAAILYCDTQVQGESACHRISITLELSTKFRGSFSKFGEGI